MVHPSIHCIACHFCLWELTRADKPSTLQLALTAALVLLLLQRAQQGIASFGRLSRSFPSVHTPLGPCSVELGSPAIKTISLLHTKMHFHSVLSLKSYQPHSGAAIHGRPIFMKFTAIFYIVVAVLT